MMDKSCYECKFLSICRLRDRARELNDYFNMTGNFMGNEFSTDLYALMGSNCYEFKKEGDD